MTALDVRIQGTRDDDVLRFTFHRALGVTMVLRFDDADDDAYQACEGWLFTPPPL